MINIHMIIQIQLLVFAFCNDGRIAEYGMVGSPATNKNGISVGAIHNSYDANKILMRDVRDYLVQI